MSKSLGAVATMLPFLSLALIGFSPLSAMQLPHCDRPDVSQRTNQNGPKHYVENPGPLNRPDVAFFSYSFLDPPTAATHQIRDSVCNIHKQNALSFKWEPVGLAYLNLPTGECWCARPPLYLSHDEIEVLDVDAAHIQFINDSASNSLPASAFVRKNRPPEKSPMDSFIDVIRHKADKLITERLWFSSSWKDGTVTLGINGATEDQDRFLVAIEMPPRLLENVKEQLTDRETVGLAASSIGDLSIKDRSWIPERILKGRVAAVSQKRPKFSDTIFSVNAAEVEPIELQVAIFSNDSAREFIAAAPITVYAPAGR